MISITILPLKVGRKPLLERVGLVFNTTEQRRDAPLQLREQFGDMFVQIGGDLV